MSEFVEEYKKFGETLSEAEIENLHNQALYLVQTIHKIGTKEIDSKQMTLEIIDTIVTSFICAMHAQEKKHVR